MTVKRGHHDSVRVRFDRRLDILLLRNHDTQIHNVKARLGERVIEDLVPNRVYVRADDADDEYLFPFFVHSCTSYSAAARFTLPHTVKIVLSSDLIKVIALAVDDDRHGEILDIQPPHGLRAEVGIGDDLRFLMHWLKSAPQPPVAPK